MLSFQSKIEIKCTFSKRFHMATFCSAIHMMSVSMVMVNCGSNCDVDDIISVDLFTLFSLLELKPGL